MFGRGLVPFLLVCASGFALPEAYLSLTVVSGSSPDTYVSQPTKCLIPLVDAKLINKVKAAAGGKQTFQSPGAVVPDIKYSAFLKKREIILERHNELGSTFNESPDAQELQDLVFELCQE